MLGSWCAAVWLLLACLPAGAECKWQAPCYSEAGVVNAASFVTGAIAPDTIFTIFGTDLAYSTSGVVDFDGARLPIQIAGVMVSFGAFPAPLYYVSPTQVNALAPRDLLPGEYDLRVTRDGRAGPAVRIRLLDTAPALFLLDAATAVATRADFSVLTAASPAHPGESVVLWATGLGPLTRKPSHYSDVPLEAVPIERLGELQVLLDGVAVAADHILYAGAAPGFAGLYQINLVLPENTGPNPAVRIAIGDQISPQGVRLPVTTASP